MLTKLVIKSALEKRTQLTNFTADRSNILASTVVIIYTYIQVAEIEKNRKSWNLNQRGKKG